MYNDVVKLSGSYKIVTNQGLGGGNIVLDLAGDADSSAIDGAVLINGDLYVNGNTVFGNVTNQTIVDTLVKDNIIILNSGETAGYVQHSGGNTSGIEIDRGNNASSTLTAKLLYNDALYWQVDAQNYRGVWEYKVGSKYSAIKVNAIQFDEGNGGIAADGRLVFFAGQVGMLNVGVNGGGTDPDYNPINDLSPLKNSYASRVLDPNDIPNKYYVDHVVALSTETSNALEAKRLKVGDSYIEIKDNSVTGQQSNITFYIDNTTTSIMSPTGFSFAGLAVENTNIRTLVTNTDINLIIEGTGQIVLDGSVAYQAPYYEPSATDNCVTVYSTTSTVGVGGSGLLFVNSVGRDELVGSRRAIVFGLVL